MILYLIPALALCVLPVLPEQRLETTVTPLHYDVDMWVNTATSPVSLNGTVCIQVNCTNNERVDVIHFHSKEKYGLRIGLPSQYQTDSISIEKLPKNKEERKKIIQVDGWKYESESDIMSISLSEPLLPGETYKLCIKYEGDVTEDNGYVIWKGRGKYIIASNFKRQAAFPCFDEPNLRATFKVQITAVPKGHSLSNVIQPKEKETPAGPQKTYELTEKFPPSQISFVVTSFKPEVYCLPMSLQWTVCLNSEYNYGRGQEDSVRWYMYRMVAKYMSLGPRSNFPKVQFIVIPDTDKKLVSFNWGLVNIRQDDLVNGEAHDRVNTQMYTLFRRMSATMFGGMISPDSWDSSWLYEALAEYIAHVQIPGQPLLNDLPRLMIKVRRETMYTSLEKGLDEYQDQTVGTHKGLMLLRMIHTHVGEKRFVSAIEDFIKKYKYASAAPNQLWELFDKEEKEGLLRRWFLKMCKGRKTKPPPGVNCKTVDSKDGSASGSLAKSTRGNLPGGRSLTDVMRTWTDKPSYPLLTVKAAGNGKFEVTQEPFVGSYQERINQEKSRSQDGNSNRCWMFPLYYTLLDTRLTASTNTKSIKKEDWFGWFDCDENKVITINTESGGYYLPLFKTNYAGMYRVKYDSATWPKIVSALQTSKDFIDPTIRAQIVHDAFALAWVGYQDYEEVIALQPYIKDEVDEFVWNAFSYGLSDLRDMLATSPQTYKAFQLFINDTITPIFTYDRQAVRIDHWYGNNPKNTTIDYWACVVGRNEKCIENMQYYFRLWMTNRAYINHGMFYMVLCTVLSEPGKLDDRFTTKVDFIMDVLFNNRAFPGEYFDVLRCSSNVEVVNRFLRWASSESSESDAATKEEKQLAYFDLAQGKDSFLPTLEYFYEHLYDEILPYHDSYDLVANLVSVLTPRMDLDQVKKMEEFVESKSDLRSKEAIKRAFEAGKAAAMLRTEWLRENDSHIRALLTEKFCKREDCSD